MFRPSNLSQVKGSSKLCLDSSAITYKADWTWSEVSDFPDKNVISDLFSRMVERLSLVVRKVYFALDGEDIPKNVYSNPFFFYRLEKIIRSLELIEPSLYIPLG